MQQKENTNLRILRIVICGLYYHGGINTSMVLPIIDMCTLVFNWVFFWAWIACEHFCEGLAPETCHGRTHE
jgi:hypothetical protein